MDSNVATEMVELILNWVEKTTNSMSHRQYMTAILNIAGKKSKIVKNEQRRVIVERYRKIREDLKARGDYEGLAKLPRNASATRLRNRDALDGRPRGYIRKFGVSRITFRELAHKGELPGVKKASW